MLLKNSTIVFCLCLLFRQNLSACIESYVIQCNELSDISKNDTSGWRYVQIGSMDEKKEYQVLNSDTMHSLTLVHSLTIINRIDHILAPIFSVFVSKLRHLNFYGNNILEINDYTFGQSSEIKVVYLENNNIQHLGQGLFQNASLDIVSLSRNSITSITTAFYRSKVKWIMLNNNRIRFIAYEAFPSNLEQLELNNNLLESVRDSLENLKNLKELYLEGNHLTTVPDFAELKQISYLHLADNEITEVYYPFTQHDKLEFLDLSSNFIKNITTDIFSKPDPPMVLLNFNRLTNVVFENPKKRTDLAFYGNPWNCDCLFKYEESMKRYKHMRTCEVNFFDKGEVPMCIESGRCGGIISVSNSEIDNFHEIISDVEKEVRILCKFRL